MYGVAFPKIYIVTFRKTIYIILLRRKMFRLIISNFIPIKYEEIHKILDKMYPNTEHVSFKN